MSAFGLETDSENRMSEQNIQVLLSPKVSEKDLSAIMPSSGDRSFKLNSPLCISGEYTLNHVSSSDQLNSLNNSTAESRSPINEAATETAQERMEREERESQELAWQLMQEDNMEMYNMQMQFMQENADQMSEEDMQLIQALVNESGRPQIAAPMPTNETEEDGEEEEEGEELNESDSSNWDYERLLQLGQQIGDVKTERWRLRAKNVINSLPRRLYKELAPHVVATQVTPVTVFTALSPSPAGTTPLERGEEQSSSNKKQCIRAAACGCEGDNRSNDPKIVMPSEVETERCVVCMDDFEAEEMLAVFPCKHYFHIPCTEGWLADHNCCPSCKTKVSATPEK